MTALFVSCLRARLAQIAKLSQEKKKSRMRVIISSKWQMKICLFKKINLDFRAWCILKKTKVPEDAF